MMASYEAKGFVVQSRERSRSEDFLSERDMFGGVTDLPLLLLDPASFVSTAAESPLMATESLHWWPAKVPTSRPLSTAAVDKSQERAVVEPVWVPTNYVFTSLTGTPGEPDNLRRSWHPLRERVGLGAVRFHDLRHTCVSLLLDLGAPPHVVREIVGHADLGVTMTIYAHASQEEKRLALERLDDRLRGALPSTSD